MQDVEESVSGFKLRGRWTEIVEHGERITRALRDSDADEEYPDAYEDWEDWRPKSHEDIDRDLSRKTAEQAAVGEGEGERAGNSPGDDVREAGERLAESYERLDDEDADAEAAVEEWRESIGYVARAADSAGRKALRGLEGTLYRRVMTKTGPHYFDTELVSANLNRVGDEEFVFEVNVNDDDLKAAVSERLSEYSDTVDRWHVDAEKNTETAEHAEGADAPDHGNLGQSKPSTN